MADNKKCKTCAHYSLYQLLTANKTFSYQGDIPCVRCCHYAILTDEYIPKLADIYKRILPYGGTYGRK